MSHHYLADLLFSSLAALDAPPTCLTNNISEELEHLKWVFELKQFLPAKKRCFSEFQIIKKLSGVRGGPWDKKCEHVDVRGGVRAIKN